MLVVGGGYSAATTVCDLAELAEEHLDTWVIWLARGAGTQPIAAHRRTTRSSERDRLAVRANTLATRGDGNVEFHAGTVVEAIESHGPDKGFQVTAPQSPASARPGRWTASSPTSATRPTPA